MELILERIAKKKTYTIGHLYIAKEPVGNTPGLGLPLTKGLQICDTLEPTWRDYANGAYKIKGRSASSNNGFPFCWAYPSSKAFAFTQATRPKTPRAAYLLARIVRLERCLIAEYGSTD